MSWKFWKRGPSEIEALTRVVMAQGKILDALCQQIDAHCALVMRLLRTGEAAVIVTGTAADGQAFVHSVSGPVDEVQVFELMPWVAIKAGATVLCVGAGVRLERVLVGFDEQGITTDYGGPIAQTRDACPVGFLIRITVRRFWPKPEHIAPAVYESGVR